MNEFDEVKYDIEEELEEITEPEVIGIVTDCSKLNVREEPKINSEIVCKLDCLTEVLIDHDESTDEFYKIYTASGMTGYCMKKYIAIRQ